MSMQHLILTPVYMNEIRGTNTMCVQKVCLNWYLTTVMFLHDYIPGDTPPQMSAYMKQANVGNQLIPQKKKH
jgi:hypothetical protein